MKVLVTGGAGFIGSHVCKLLAAKGHAPVVYDNLSRGNRSAVKWGPLEEGDIADVGRVKDVLQRHRPDALMHFAAFAYVGESVQNPIIYYHNNIGGSAALLEAVVDAHRVPIVFSSSCATYGLPEKVPITEDHPQNPINPYGYTKLVVERMLADIDAVYGVRSVSLRYFNAAGSDPEGEIGEQHDPETHLIPLVLRAARDGTPMRVFGDDYETPDGTCVRDYIHVCDLADAHVRALEYLLAGGKTTAFNLANARGYSVRDVITVAEKVCGRPVRVEMTARRPGDPPVLIGAAGVAEKVLGWKPAHSDLAGQITDTWNWMRKTGT